jgi:LysR family transcriptional regulator, glycine cleavage system transcriptional activator
MKRTLLPLNALRVFDAAARHLNFTRAADELAVTPAAVGQQIRAMEDLLGVVLFRRTPKGLELTAEATAGLDALRAGFLSLEESVAAMQGGQGSNTLTLAVPREVQSRWLMPALAPYLAANPSLTLSIVPSEGENDFAESNLDLAIWLTTPAAIGDMQGADLGAAGFVEVGVNDAPPRALIWPGFGPRAVGQSAGDPETPPLRLPDLSAAIAAAEAGLGRVTVPRLLVADAMANGALISYAESQDPRQYRILAPAPQWRQAKVKALVAALTSQSVAI